MHNFIDARENELLIEHENKKQLIESKRVHGYLSAMPEVATFGVSNAEVIDSVLVTWPSGNFVKKTNVAVNQTIEVNASTKTNYSEPIRDNTKSKLYKQSNTLGLTFEHRENSYDDFAKEILLPYKQSTLGPFITTADVNNDGLEDVFIGGASGQASALFLQTKNGFEATTQPAFIKDAAHEDMQALFFDADADGNLDIFIPSGGNAFVENHPNYTDRLYLNDGNGRFTKNNQPAIQANKVASKTAISLDYDGDGDLDLIVGTRIIPQKYPSPAPNFIFENENGTFKDVTNTISQEWQQFGIVNQIIITDFNQDGQGDFVAVGEWGSIGFFEYREKQFKLMSNALGVDTHKGWWFSITEADLNHDSRPDYIVGNAGKNIKFSASAKKPFTVYGNDFDDNGTFDIVLSKQYNGKQVPVRGRECSSQQMPFILDKFETYADFASASLQDIYGDKLESAVYGEVNTLQSIALIQNEDGTFQAKDLPNLAQSFPLLTAVQVPLNGNKKALLLAGAIFDTEVETPRLDFDSGLELRYSSSDFESVNWLQDQLGLSGNIKD